MAVIPLPASDASGPEVQSRLISGFGVEVPVVEWEGQRFVRVSIQTYTTPADMDHLVEAFTTLL